MVPRRQTEKGNKQCTVCQQTITNQSNQNHNTTTIFAESEAYVGVHWQVEVETNAIQKVTNQSNHFLKTFFIVST